MAKNCLQSLHDFFSTDLWQVDTNELPRLKRMGYNTAKIFILTLRQIFDDHILDRAASITYTTLFSIIPILALLFAIANGLGFGNLLQEELRKNSSFINQQYDMVFSLIDSYLAHAQSGIFIGAGVLMLFVSVYFLTSSIDQNINDIWQTRKARNPLRMMTDYFSMLFIIPVLMIVTSGITIFMATYVRQLEGFLILGPLVQFFIKLIPYALTCCIFMALYVFVPNTHVKFRHVIIPGILAGSAFQAFQYVYINSQIWVSSYNAIYGSFAAIPFFLFWANMSWVICLIGVEVSYLSQNLQSIGDGSEGKRISRLNHDCLAVAILSLLCKRVGTDQAPYTAEALSKEIKLPLRLTTRILCELVDCRQVYCTIDYKDRNDEIRYVPAIDVSRATVGSLLHTLDTYGGSPYALDLNSYGTGTKRVSQLRHQSIERNDQILLKDL